MDVRPYIKSSFCLLKQKKDEIVPAFIRLANLGCLTENSVTVHLASVIRSVTRERLFVAWHKVLGLTSCTHTWPDWGGNGFHGQSRLDLCAIRWRLRNGWRVALRCSSGSAVVGRRVVVGSPPGRWWRWLLPYLIDQVRTSWFEIPHAKCF